MSCCDIILEIKVLTKVILLHKSKDVLNSGLVKEVVIWQVPKSTHYPQGIRYRLVIADPVWKKVLLLFDNHAPKGPHWHDKKGQEHIYKFISVERLIEEFKKMQTSLEKEYENHEN